MKDPGTGEAEKCDAVSVAAFQKKEIISTLDLSTKITIEVSMLMEPHGQARGTSSEIPSAAKASEGCPPVAKSTEALSFGHGNHLTTFLRIHPRVEPVVFCAGG